jgi:hypothetical protein
MLPQETALAPGFYQRQCDLRITRLGQDISLKSVRWRFETLREQKWETQLEVVKLECIHTSRRAAWAWLAGISWRPDVLIHS